MHFGLPLDNLPSQYEVSYKKDVNNSVILANMNVSIILEDGGFSSNIFSALVSSIPEKNMEILNQKIIGIVIVKAPNQGIAQIKDGMLFYTPIREGGDQIILKIKSITGALILFKINITIDSAAEA